MSNITLGEMCDIAIAENGGEIYESSVTIISARFKFDTWIIRESLEMAKVRYEKDMEICPTCDEYDVNCMCNDLHGDGDPSNIFARV